MKERLVIVFIAAILGLLITTAGFFIYQSTKALPNNDSPQPVAAKTKVTEPQATPTPPSGLYLIIDTPTDESLVGNRTINIKGKTNPDNTLVISSNQEDVEAKPTSDGTFSTTITIDTGTNKIITRAISPTGDEKMDQRIVTYSTEDF